MLELMQNLSWVAVIAGTVTAFVAGWIWYSPLNPSSKNAKAPRIRITSADTSMLTPTNKLRRNSPATWHTIGTTGILFPM